MVFISVLSTADIGLMRPAIGGSASRGALAGKAVNLGERPGLLGPARGRWDPRGAAGPYAGLGHSTRARQIFDALGEWKERAGCGFRAWLMRGAGNGAGCPLSVGCRSAPLAPSPLPLTP